MKLINLPVPGGRATFFLNRDHVRSVTCSLATFSQKVVIKLETVAHTYEHVVATREEAQAFMKENFGVEDELTLSR
ncbi:hypothetical protein OU994_29750 [Pseudoduganella sp. SL102]|uniref:hypothetical protein n=1 Tax=Pseudoduganella sp. SL102 TaxID=2995154 RepID=UPI00248CB29F|nr:hypothetical protein [Pseudoduganella sp. SL102]WBS02378.1 hypothetical protein OU994_29750 [Pseudoduganella sp. SL102]